jgi:biopolymer transport protein ExbD
MATPVQRPGELISGINVTPLVDVMLVLLVVMMVAGQYVASRAIPMDLPRASTGDTQSTPPLAISIDAAGAIFLDGERVSQADLRQRVRTRGDGAQGSALIAADGGARHRTVVAVIDVLRQEGISKLALNVAAEEAP